jgi:hypothetical protein
MLAQLLTRYLIGNSLILGNLGKVLKSDKSIIDFMIVENGAFFGTGYLFKWAILLQTHKR